MTWVIHRQVREIVELVSKKQPTFMFLMETKVNSAHTKQLRVKLGFDGLFYVDSLGLRGGLRLLWRNRGVANLINFSKNNVDFLSDSF